MFVKTKNFFFYCPACDQPYKKTPQEIVFQDEVPLFVCPKCGKLTKSISPQRYSALMGRDKATGPKTPEGKKRSALNSRLPRKLSPESAERIGVNAYKTGQYATRLRPLAPAKFDKYPSCTNCEPETRERCEAKEIKWCPTNHEPLLKFLAAYKDGKPELLKELAGMTQAQVYQVIQMSLKNIFDQGVTVEEKRQIGKMITTIIKSHPLIERLPELMNSIGFTADQQMITPAKQEARDNIRGFLDDQSDKMKKSTDEYLLQMNDMLAQLRDEFRQKANEMRQKDQALNQYETEKALEKESNEVKNENR
jgi:hypothetical protein